jgi:hypothetical protein
MVGLNYKNNKFVIYTNKQIQIMGVEIIFQKPIKLSEIESKTDIKVVYHKDCLGLTKGEYGLRVSRLFVENANDIYISELNYRDKGLEIVFELIIAFQTLVMTDEEEEELLRGFEIDKNKLFLRKTLEYGFSIDNGLITLNK